MRDLYELVEEKSLRIALENGKVRIRDLKGLGCKATIIKHLKSMVEKGLLKKGIDETTHKQAYYIQPKGIAVLCLKDANQRLINFLHLLSKEIDFSMLPTESLVYIFQGFLYSFVLSLLHSILLVNETIKHEKEVMKEGFISSLAKTSTDKEKEILSNIFDKIFELSERWENVPTKLRNKLYKEHGDLIQIIKKLKEMRDETSKEIMLMLLDSHLSYIKKVLDNSYIQSMLHEAVKRNDLPEKLYPIAKPFLETINKAIDEAEKIAEKDETVKIFLERYSEIYEEMKKFREKFKGKDSARCFS